MTGQPATDRAELLEARNRAYQTYALLVEVGDDSWDALGEWSRLNRRLWETREGK